MKILFLTTLIPYPCNDGGKIKTLNALSVLCKRHDIDVTCFSEAPVSEEQYAQMRTVCKEFYPFERRITASVNRNHTIWMCFRSLFVKAPYVMYKYSDRSMTDFLKHALEKKQYDLVYIDHLQMSIYLSILKEYDIDIVLDEHNCESAILQRRMKQAGNPIVKAFYHLEYQKLRNFEKESILTVKRVITLSKEDQMLMNNLCGIEINQKFFQLPIMVQNQSIKDVSGYRPDLHINILFLGTLTWEPNNHGMIWFVQNVLPILDTNNMDIYIVGKSPSAHLIELCKKYEFVHVEGFVEDIDVYFEKSDFMIVPLFIGSGQRVKIIESFARGFPVIATSIGAEGLQYSDQEDILIANTEEEFVNAIETIKDVSLYQKIAANCQAKYMQYYSQNALQERILDSVELGLS